MRAMKKRATLVEVRGGEGAAGGSSSSAAAPGRRTDRGLFLRDPVKGGETVLVDDPLLIYVDDSIKHAVCSSCFRMPAGEELPCRCDACGEAWFCNEACKAAAAASQPGDGHTPQECELLKKLSGAIKKMKLHEPSEARMLVKAALINASDSKRWGSLKDLCAPSVGSEEQHEEWNKIVKIVKGLGGACAGLSDEDAKEMLYRDACNGMGILAPRPDPGEDLRLRAAALYGLASYINHSCAPNVARFDNFDADGEGNTKILLRALTDMDVGTELKLNYLSITKDLEERQERLLDEYGFVCDCERCRLETLFDDDDDEDEEDDHGRAGRGKGAKENAKAEPSEEEEDLFNAMMLFLAKYTCPVEECGGTMAPVAPNSAAARRPSGSAGSTEEDEDSNIVMECNRCSGLVQGLARMYHMLDGGDSD